MTVQGSRCRVSGLRFRVYAYDLECRFQRFHDRIESVGQAGKTGGIPALIILNPCSHLPGGHRRDYDSATKPKHNQLKEPKQIMAERDLMVQGHRAFE